MSVLAPVASDTLGIELAPAFPDLLVSILRCGQILHTGIVRCGGHRCGEQDPEGWLFPVLPEVI